MADVHDGRVKIALEVGDQVQHGRLDGHVQGGGRLVHDQQGRVVEQGHGDDHALLLSARDLVGIAPHDVGRVGHVDPFQHLDAFFFGIFFLHAPVNGQHLGHLVAQAHGRIEGLHGVLVDHGDAVAPDLAQFLLWAAHQILALKEDVAVDDAAVAPQEVDDAERHGALATARLAHDAVGLASHDLKAHVAHGRHVPLARLVRDSQVLDV